MIVAVCWVPKGVSKVVPVVVEPPSKEEIEEILKSNALERRCPGKTPGNNFEDITDGLKELDMEHYDEEDDGIQVFRSELGDAYYPSNDMDPYMKDKDDDDDEEEIEDMVIKPTDAVIVCARNEDDVSHLEVWIFEELGDGDSNMYVHHDIILPAFPLCTIWIDCNLKGGNKEGINSTTFMNVLEQHFLIGINFRLNITIKDFYSYVGLLYREMQIESPPLTHAPMVLQARKCKCSCSEDNFAQKKQKLTV
ncbi:hypothetical protein MRB53_006299 [Persea americana]|uniref:Uncharacterized protein n=1 Tax=Persea americana TaxID=3435 RepID=A0ACC2MFZ9_PERAE|nr:hypothetical protein MRB53_006299 [Persea americana]